MGSDFEISHPAIARGSVEHRDGKVVGPVKFAQTFIQPEELLWELAQVEARRLREIVDAAHIVNRLRPRIVGDKCHIGPVLAADAGLERLIGGRAFHV